MKFKDIFSISPKQFGLDSMKSIVPLILLFYLVPLFYENQFLFFLLAVMLIATNSLNVVYGFTGYLPFGFAVFIAFGAYTAGMVINFLHFPLILAIVAGGFSSVLLALVFTPLLKLNGAYFAIASLAAFEAVYNIYNNGVLKSLTGGPYGLDIHVAYTPNIDYAIVAIIAIISSLVILVIKRTNFGLVLQAIRDDRLAAGLMGINTLKFRTYAWIISSFFAGMAGSLLGIYLGFFYPSGVFDLTQFSILVIVFLIFGGKGTYLGPIIGTIVLFALYEFLTIYYPTYYLFVFGIIIIFLILFLPDGVTTIFSKRVKGVY